MQTYNSLSEKLTVAGSTLDTESVHQLRKGTKQLRAHLHLLRQLKGQQKETEKLRQSVKELARILAGHRDADVMEALLQELINQTTDIELTALMKELQGLLRKERQPQIKIQHIHKMVKEIDIHSHQLLSHEPETNEINPLLEIRLNKLCGAGRDYLYSTEINWDEVHNWRKQVKQLTYQYKLKKNPTPRDLTIIRILDQLGDHLGKINDFNILNSFARQQQKINTRALTLLSYTNFHSLLNEHKYALLAQSQNKLAELKKLVMSEFEILASHTQDTN